MQCIYYNNSINTIIFKMLAVSMFLYLTQIFNIMNLILTFMHNISINIYILRTKLGFHIFSLPLSLLITLTESTPQN